MSNDKEPTDFQSPVKILMVASLASSLRNFRGNLILEMINRGHEVHVAAPNLFKDKASTEWLEKAGAIAHNIYLSRASLSPFNELRTIVSLLQIMLKVRPELFFGYTIKPVIWGLIVSSWCKIPQRVGLISGLGYTFSSKKNKTFKLISYISQMLYRTAIRRSTLVFFQNPDDLNVFRDLGIISPAQNVALINGSGVDLNFFPEKPMPPLPLRCLFIGRLLEDKGVREYAETAKVIGESYADVHFTLVGGLNERPGSISAQEVNRWVLNKNLRWEGELDDVRTAITDSHLLVLPSYREGTPRAVLEAMSMGRPVIVTDVPGCRETVIDGYNGFKVPVRDVAGIVRSIEKFIHTPDNLMKMGKAGRNLAIRKYDVHKVNKVMVSKMKL